MEPFASVLEQAGGADAPTSALGRLRIALGGELVRGSEELALPRSGYGGSPVVVVFAATDDGAAALLPVSAKLHADTAAVPDRAVLVAVAATGALVEAGGAAPLCGAQSGELLLVGAGADPELAALAFDEAVDGVDRLRARGVVVPGSLLGSEEELRPPVGATHRLRIAATIAAAGGDPVDPSPEQVDAALLLLEPGGAAARPHEDPDPPRRVARRILQRLNGMGKWGGYHTEFVHLGRGFAGNDRALAEAVGEALLQAGLLVEKPSVGQRHVSLNPRRKSDIQALLDRAQVPAGLVLPATPA